MFSMFNREDPAFAALIDQFAAELCNRIETIDSALAAGDVETLRRTGHQIKGAAASYGFDVLTKPAHELQLACDEQAGEPVVVEAARTLRDACREANNAHTPATVGG